MNKKDFAAFLRAKRKELNLTQDELAEKLYISRNIISRWENGVSYPDLETTQRLAEVLGVEPNEIFKQSSINDDKQAIKTAMIIAPIIGLIVLVGLIIMPLATHRDKTIIPADSENRYYFVQDDNTLVYYDFERSEIKELFKIDDHDSKNVWNYNNRLYMIESNNEGDRVVSYDLEGKDKRNHVIINQGISDQGRAPIYSICFNNGYLYYVLNSRYTQVFRVAIDESSKPELLTSYQNSITQSAEITLTATPQIVYINHKYLDINTGKNTFILDYYDVNTNSIFRVFETDNKLYGCLFDDNGNMYYATAKDNQYTINKFNVYTKSQEKFYSISCNTDEFSDAEYMQMQLFDGKYFYVTRGVNETKKIEDYVADIVKYGHENLKTLTTKVNSNYIYVLDLNGNCVDITELPAGEKKDRYDKQTGYVPYSLFTGNSQKLIIKTNNYNKKYDKMYAGSMVDGSLLLKEIE